MAAHNECMDSCKSRLSRRAVEVSQVMLMESISSALVLSFECIRIVIRMAGLETVGDMPDASLHRVAGLAVIFLQDVLTINITEAANGRTLRNAGITCLVHTDSNTTYIWYMVVVCACVHVFV